jgi:hypothetical protein
MKQRSVISSLGSVAFRILKPVAFVAGGFLLYRHRNKVRSFLTRQSLLISALYAVLIAFIALFYRFFMLLNWILQHGR